MNILILRHGQASMDAKSDAERPLTDRGRVDAQNAGRTLASLGVQFDCAWVSPFLRTQQTADEALKAYPELARYNKDFLTPESSPHIVLQELKSSGLDNVLLISHQPLVSALAALLSESSSAYGPSMSPASMAYLTSKDLLPGCGELQWLRHAPEFNRY